jgi:hypothetical protein
MLDHIHQRPPPSLGTALRVLLGAAAEARAHGDHGLAAALEADAERAVRASLVAAAEARL